MSQGSVLWHLWNERTAWYSLEVCCVWRLWLVSCLLHVQQTRLVTPVRQIRHSSLYRVKHQYIIEYTVHLMHVVLAVEHDAVCKSISPNDIIISPARTKYADVTRLYRRNHSLLIWCYRMKDGVHRKRNDRKWWTRKMRGMIMANRVQGVKMHYMTPIRKQSCFVSFFCPSCRVHRRFILQCNFLHRHALYFLSVNDHVLHFSVLHFQRSPKDDKEVFVTLKEQCAVWFGHSVAEESVISMCSTTSMPI